MTDEIRHPEEYVAGALERILGTVADAPESGRNDALFKATANLAGIVAVPGCPLSESDARDRLYEAARGAGLLPHEIQPTIKSGWDRGSKNPKQIRFADAAGVQYTPRHLASEERSVPRPEPEPEYRPQQDVDSIWYSAKKIDATAKTEPIKWLARRRGIDAATVGKHDLARELLDAGSLPKWARVRDRGDWYAAGFRLVVPMFDADGVRRSIRARYTGETDTLGRPNTAAKYSGCVMANRPALELLRGTGKPATVVISEGEPDYLTAAVTWSTLPVFGVASGSWKIEHAQRIPDGSTVVIRTDNDATGDKYAEAIRKTFTDRNVQVLRKTETLDDEGKPMDDNDMLKKVRLPDDPTADCEPMETPPGAPESAGTNERPRAKVEPIGPVFDAAWERLIARADGKEKPIATPWENLNDHLGGGFWPGELVPIVGNTGSGKTQWALQIAWHNARAGRPVYYVALESDPMEMMARLMVLEYAEKRLGRVAWSDLYHGTKPGELITVGNETSKAIRELPLSFIFGEPLQWNPEELRELLHADHEAGEQPLVVVDFLQLIGSNQERVDIRERISAGSYQLRSLARKYNAAILVLSATARKYYDFFNGTKRSGNDGLVLGESPPEKLQGSGKESGEIEYAAATVIALCRKQWEKGKDAPPVHVAIVKARAGKRGWIGPLGFDGTGYTEQPGAKGGSRVHK